MSSKAFECIQNSDFDGLKTLLEADAGLASSKNELGVSLLMQTLYYHKTEMRDLVLKYSAEIDFFEACALGRAERASACLDETPECLQNRTGDGFTGLHLAAFMGHDSVVRLLIEQGSKADAIAENPSVVTALHSAVAGGNPACVKALVDAGANLEARQVGGFTPLMGAAAGNKKEMVEMLLAAGADRTPKDENDQTAADHASGHGHTDLAAMLT